MSTCLTDKFVITRGVENTFEFTIKANGTTLPLELTPTDTFSCELRGLENSTVILTKEMVKMEPLLNGKVKLTLSIADASVLDSLRGAPEDKYYLRSNYSLIIIADTAGNGKFIAKVGEVYVD